MMRPSGVVTTAEATGDPRSETHMQQNQVRGNAPGAEQVRQLSSLSPQMKRLVRVIAAGGATIAAIGFVGSYKALQKLGDQQGLGFFSYAFPVGIDVGIVVLLAIDLVLSWMRIRFPLLRQTAWLLTASTIAFNAASAWPHPLGVAVHAVIPLLFIGIVEAARFTVARTADLAADQHMEGVRFVRWILAPVATFKLWRKMRLYEIRSYEEIVALEQRRLVYRAILRYEYGRNWRRSAPIAEVLPLKLAKFGRDVPELTPPQTDLSKRYAPTVTVERMPAAPADPVEQADRPALLGGLPPELLSALTALVERTEQPVEHAPVTVPVVEQPGPVTLEKVAHGMVPLGVTSPKQFEEKSSTWFRRPPEENRMYESFPAEVETEAQEFYNNPEADGPQIATSPEELNRWATVRPQPAQSPRPAGVRVTIPQQDLTEFEFQQRPEPFQPVAEVEPEVFQPVAVEPEPVALVEPVAPPAFTVEPELELEPVEPQESPSPLVDGPKLTGKQRMVMLYRELDDQHRALSDNALAPIVAAKLGITEGSARKYLGAIKSGKLPLD